ncbi:MAG TPA: aldo/keto reductase [Ktedonosporobacter sp.]|nr:aldo/keto reductase [Ktedonosporobacter sp.]
MEKRQLGKTDMSVGVLGFGGSEIHDEHAEYQDIEHLLNSALDDGLNVIDTAECYGLSEEFIGRAVSHRRDEYYLFTKCGHAAGFDLSDWSPQLLEKSIERSLQRLRTEYVDLVQLHSCSEEILRQGDVILALQRMREAGKVRYIGFSGDKGAARYAVECGVFDTLQTSINIVDQSALELTLPLAREREIGIIAKRPIANAVWRYGKTAPTWRFHYTYWEQLNRLAYPFLQSDPDQAVSIALRFTLSIPGIHTAILGTARPGRWQQNKQLLEAGPLPKGQFDEIHIRWEEVAQSM